MKNIRQQLSDRRSLDERFKELDAHIEDPSFRTTSGMANEVNYWVFDYEPERELDVREHIEQLKRRNSREDFSLVVFDLYDLIIDYLDAKHFTDKTILKEKKQGFDKVILAIRRTLKINSQQNYLVTYMSEHIPENAVVLLTGIGKCYPILEAPEVFNKILYNMPSAFSATPMILFYPGTYTEQELIVFNEKFEDNYYRAFRIAR